MDFVFDPSLVLYLPLYQLDGASFVSKDAHGHLCSVTGALWRPNGRYFDGTDDSISCGNDSVLDFTTQNFTLEVWARLSELTSHKCLVVRGVENVSGYSFRIPNNERLWMETAQSGVRQSNYTAVDQVVANQWYHLVAIRSGTLAIFYRDTENIALEAAAAIVNPATNTNNFIVGDESGISFDMAGDIGEVRVYNRALTPLEIQHNYLSTKWRYR